MSKIIYKLSEAKTSLPELIDRAASGEKIILCKAGKPVAKLVPLCRSPEPRQPGGWEGKVKHRPLGADIGDGRTAYLALKRRAQRGRPALKPFQGGFRGSRVNWAVSPQGGNAVVANTTVACHKHEAFS